MPTARAAWWSSATARNAPPVRGLLKNTVSTATNAASVPEATGSNLLTLLPCLSSRHPVRSPGSPHRDQPADQQFVKPVPASAWFQLGPSVTGPGIRVDHVRVVARFVGRAAGPLEAVAEGDHPVREVHDHAHVVLAQHD